MGGRDGAMMCLFQRTGYSVFVLHAHSTPRDAFSKRHYRRHIHAGIGALHQVLVKTFLADGMLQWGYCADGMLR